MSIEDIIKIVGAFVLAVFSVIPPMTAGAKMFAPTDDDDTVFMLALLVTIGEIIGLMIFLLKMVM